MEPNARNMFDEVLKRLDDMETRSSERWERWEKRFNDSSAERQEGARRRRRQTADVAGEVRLCLVQHRCRRRQLGGRTSSSLYDLELRTMDLELIRIHEIHDERDGRVEALESEVKEIVTWCPKVDGLIDFLRTEMKWLSKH